MKCKVKHSFIIILLLAVAVFSNNIFVKADSGFDSSWDSGSSSWDSDSSWDSSYSDSDSVGGIESFIVFLVILGIIYVVSKIKDDSSDNQINDKVDLESIKLLGDDFDFDSFYKQVFKIYKDVQIAWMNRDIEPVRNLLTDEMFNMYDMQIMTLETKKQINKMEDITYVSAKVTKVEENNNLQTIYVNLVVTCRDYLIDEKTKKVLRGNEEAINNYTYLLTFTHKLTDSTLTNCPNCNAKLEDKHTNKCQYCGTIIQNNSKDYVLASKKMLNQYVKYYKKKGKKNNNGRK